MEQAKEDVDRFKVDLLNDPFLMEYNNLEELFVKFKTLAFNEPDEHQLEVLKNQFSGINEEIRKELQKRRNPALAENKWVRRDKFIEEFQRDEQFVDEVVKNIDNESAHIRVLSALRKNYEQELKYGPSRRQIAFGYVSQVSFAIVGVVFPLMYGSWSGYLGDNSNLVAIGLWHWPGCNFCVYPK